MNWFRFHGCKKCRGDLVLDEGDWICLQCGTYYYTGLYQSKIVSSDKLRPTGLYSETPSSEKFNEKSVGVGFGPTASESTVVADGLGFEHGKANDSVCVEVSSLATQR